MNANAFRFVEIAHKAGLVNTGPPPGAPDGSLQLSAIANAMGAPAWLISHWLRDSGDKSARPCPIWAVRLLAYLVNDPDSPIFSGKAKPTIKVDSSFSEMGQVTSERQTPTLAPIKWGSDLR